MSLRISGSFISFVALLLVASRAEASDQSERCSAAFSRLLPEARAVFEKVKARYSLDQTYPGWVQEVHRARDWIRDRLQTDLHHRDYPVIALDDATSINAYALANDAFGGLPEEQKSLVNIEQIKTSLGQLLDQVEHYSKNMHDFLDETASFAMQERVLTEELGRRGRDGLGFDDIFLPRIRTSDDGKMDVKWEPSYFASFGQLLNERNRLSTELEKRLAKRFFGLNEGNNHAIAQALNLKRLETYLHEIRRAILKYPGKALPEDLRGFQNRIEALYKDQRKFKFKEEFLPPPWAWNRLRWMQLGGEWRSIFQKDIPRLLDQEANNKLIQFVKRLTPEEKRALGIYKAAEAVNFLSRYRWVTVLSAGVGGTSGVGGLGMATWTYFIADGRAKEACAAISNEDLFVDCAQQYLQERFPAEAIGALFNNRGAFLDPEGKVSDPELLAELRDILRRRHELTEGVLRRENARRKLTDFIGDLGGKVDMSSPRFRRRIVETKDQGKVKGDDLFIAELMGSEKPRVPWYRSLLQNFGGGEKKSGTSSYLGFLYPFDFEQNRFLVKKILLAAPNSDEQKKDLEELKKRGPALATELQQLLEDRERFRRGEAYIEPIRPYPYAPYSNYPGTSAFPPFPGGAGVPNQPPASGWQPGTPANGTVPNRTFPRQ